VAAGGCNSIQYRAVRPAWGVRCVRCGRCGSATAPCVTVDACAVERWRWWRRPVRCRGSIVERAYTHGHWAHILSSALMCVWACVPPAAATHAVLPPAGAVGSQVISVAQLPPPPAALPSGSRGVGRSCRRASANVLAPCRIHARRRRRRLAVRHTLPAPSCVHVPRARL